MVQSSNEPWTDEELKRAVDAYVFLLEAERSGLKHPREASLKLVLSGSLKARNEASLRYRMRNISAVVAELGGPVLSDYSPAERVGRNVRTRLRAILSDHAQFSELLQGRDTESSSKDIEGSRQEARERLRELMLQISELERELIGIGHNRPPEPLVGEGLARADLEKARQDIAVLGKEVDAAAPDRQKVEEHSSQLLEFGLKIAVWAGERATKFADVSLKILAPIVVAKITGLAPLVIDTVRAIARALAF